MDRHFTLTSPQHSSRLASDLAGLLSAGDVILLQGDLGAGKSHFARAVIQARLPVPEDVPSPTFTLVQTYDTGDVEIWHADLYRLTHVDELFELGLDEAYETAICLIEWPDRLGDLAPDDALTLTLRPGSTDDERAVTASFTADRWQEILDRAGA